MNTYMLYACPIDVAISMTINDLNVRCYMVVILLFCLSQTIGTLLHETYDDGRLHTLIVMVLWIPFPQTLTVSSDATWRLELDTIVSLDTTRNDWQSGRWTPVFRASPILGGRRNRFCIAQRSCSYKFRSLHRFGLYYSSSSWFALSTHWIAIYQFVNRFTDTSR